MVWNGTVVDGHNRYEICTAHGIRFDTVERDFADRSEAILWILRNQLARRNLNNYQRADVAFEIETEIATKAKANQLRTTENRVCPKSDKQPIDTKKELAKIAGVGHNTINQVKVIRQYAPPEVKQKLESGAVTINKAYNDIRREQAREQRSVELVQRPIPTGRYDVILADPPWRYEFSETQSREIENHYPTMSLDEIKALAIPVEDNAVLLLWTTAPKLEESLQVLNAWGFTYRTCAVWDKEKIGMGYWFRIQHELLLVGVRGTYPTPAPENRKSSVIRSPREAHSKKPAAIYTMVEQMFPGGKYLELFARSERPGWTPWGNEV